jgi:hypothetical protein
MVGIYSGQRETGDLRILAQAVEVVELVAISI